METPVRYYITQDDDRPVVRTVPVTTHPLPRAVQRPDEATVAEAASTPERPKRGPVRRIVRAAARKAHLATS